MMAVAGPERSGSGPGVPVPSITIIVFGDITAAAGHARAPMPSSALVAPQAWQRIEKAYSPVRPSQGWSAAARQPDRPPASARLLRCAPAARATSSWARTAQGALQWPAPEIPLQLSTEAADL